MSSKWFYAKDGERLGPVLLPDLKELVRSGRVLSTDMVREEGQEKWLEASSVQRISSTEPHNAPAEVLSELDQEKLNGTISAFLAVPLYMVSIGLMATSVVAFAAKGHAIKSAVAKLIAVFYVALVGIGIRSLQCIFLLRSNPFKAVAMGRFIFGLYVLVSVGFSLYNDWPRHQLVASMADVQDFTASTSDQPKSIGVLGPLPGLHQRTSMSNQRPRLLAVEASKAEIKEPGWLDYLGMVVTTAADLAEKIALLIFLQLVYLRLKGSKPDYSLDNLLHDITFGWKGTKYTWGSQTGTQRKRREKTGMES
jgi:hypothetical protein